MFGNGALCNHPSRIPCVISHNGKGLTPHSTLVSSLSFNRRFMAGAVPLDSQNSRKLGIAPLVQGERMRTVRKSRRYVSAAFGDYDMTADSNIFPRINTKDPYQRLGISREASEEEIQAARNFLIKKYSNHKPSVDAIESAHDKIIMQAFLDRKNPKIDYNEKIKEVKQSKFLKFISTKFETPSLKVILKNAVAFIALVILTALFPTEDGPTVQVAISLGLTIYFIYERIRSCLWAFLYGVGWFFTSWFIGTFFMVAVIPPLFQGTRNLEISTSIVTYILLWFVSTYFI